MPALAPRKCGHPGCRRLAWKRRCSKHMPRRALDAARPSARERMYTKAWERARAAFLAAHPTCAHHEAEGRLAPSSVVDHVVPHRGSMSLFWDETNWQALCADCHNAKTARENGLAPCTHRIVKAGGKRACALCGGVKAAATRGRGVGISGASLRGPRKALSARADRIGKIGGAPRRAS